MSERESPALEAVGLLLHHAALMGFYVSWIVAGTVIPVFWVILVGGLQWMILLMALGVAIGFFGATRTRKTWRLHWAALIGGPTMLIFCAAASHSYLQQAEQLKDQGHFYVVEGILGVCMAVLAILGGCAAGIGVFGRLAAWTELPADDCSRVQGHSPGWDAARDAVSFLVHAAALIGYGLSWSLAGAMTLGMFWLVVCDRRGHQSSEAGGIFWLMVLIGIGVGPVAASYTRKAWPLHLAALAVSPIIVLICVRSAGPFFEQADRLKGHGHGIFAGLAELIYGLCMIALAILGGACTGGIGVFGRLVAWTEPRADPSHPLPIEPIRELPDDAWTSSHVQAGRIDHPDEWRVTPTGGKL